MSLVIKICGLRTAGDVAAAVDSGADAIGFVFADSVRRIDPADARRASASAPGHVLRVAVMKHPAPRDWQIVLDEFAPDVLQTDAADLAHLDVPGRVRLWPVYRQGGADPDVARYAEFLYEGPVSGAGETVDWRHAARLARRGNMMLAGGLAAGNVGAAIATVAPWGVDVSSAVESAPGIKDPSRIRAFIDAARAAEQT